MPSKAYRVSVLNFSITGREEPDTEPFGLNDLYAAYQLQKVSEKYQFGRKAIESRRSTRFLFYMIVIKLLKAVMIQAHTNPTNTNITAALLKLFTHKNQLACDALLDTAIRLIDEYMTPGNDESYDVRQITHNINRGTLLVTEQCQS